MGYRYIGAKTRVIDAVLGEVGRTVTRGTHVVDLMCGTGAVAQALRVAGYRVTANDLMTYAYHHARVCLLFCKEPSFKKARSFVKEFNGEAKAGLFPATPHERMISALNNVPRQEGYFWREFSQEGQPKNTPKPRNYFSPHNAAKIDGIRYWIHRLKEEGKLGDLEHSLLIHELIMAANDVANIAGTYGHYMAKLVGRAKDHIVLKPAKLMILPDMGRHSVTRGYAEEVAGKIECDLCYIDPPYMKRQYAANYHVLETLARGDEPAAVGVSGLRPWRDQYSDFCTKTRIRQAFGRVFGQMKCKHFLVSYSEDGLLTLDALTEMCSRFGQVGVRKFVNKRFKSNNSQLAPVITEFLIHLEVK